MTYCKSTLCALGQQPWKRASALIVPTETWPVPRSPHMHMDILQSTVAINLNRVDGADSLTARVGVFDGKSRTTCVTVDRLYRVGHKKTDPTDFAVYTARVHA